MKQIKVCEATGLVLDWLVAKCEGYDTVLTPARDVLILRKGVADYFDPHRNWGWGGPILEREGLLIRPQPGNSWDSWKHGVDEPGYSIGPTPLIAAMRCYLVSRLGETAEVPDELI